MYQPLITIGISTYNRATSLQKHSLSAIAELTYPNYEVVVVNDCSSDETLKVLNEHIDKIKGLRILSNERNRGLCYSRNRILQEAKGKIIVFTDDDVSLFPSCLDEIAKVYSHDSKTMFAWGCVYQCHGSYDRNQPTFATGSLFSIHSVVSKHLRFDTNIRYFKTYGCEEHEFSRRVRKARLPLVNAELAKANHYEAPAKDRAWRGLGGDLNYLYEQVKGGSILKYYVNFILGMLYLIQRLFGFPLGQENNKNPYKYALYAFHRIAVLVREKKLVVAGKYLYYVALDIPIKARSKRKIDAKQLQDLIQEYQKYQK